MYMPVNTGDCGVARLAGVALLAGAVERGIRLETDAAVLARIRVDAD